MLKVNKTGSKIFKVYKKAAGFAGRINTKIILSVFYFSVIPVFKTAFLFVTLVKSKKKLNSNWKVRESSYSDEHKYPF